jgi:hypothetical protein
MNYTVDWIASAQARLEEIWIAAADKFAVLNAAKMINSLLADDPYRKDAIMVGDENTFVVEPLAADYAVFDDAKRVLVLKVWWIGYLADQN